MTTLLDYLEFYNVYLDWVKVQEQVATETELCKSVPIIKIFYTTGTPE